MGDFKEFSLDDMADKWPSSVVARSEVARFSGGLLHPRSMANLDCAGMGPGGRFRVGKKIVYRVGELISWIEQRSALPEAKS